MIICWFSVKDPKQKDILQYFNEDLFPEDAFLTESPTDQTTANNPLASSTMDASKTPKTLFQYFKASDSAKDSTKTSQESTCDDSDGTIDWADDIDDVLDDICDDDYEIEEPVPKKSKVK